MMGQGMVDVCDLCGGERRNVGRIWNMVNRKSKQVAACTRCLELIIDVLVAIVDRRKDIPKKRPRSVTRVSPVDVFSMVGADETMPGESNVQERGNVA
jgi:hypothetical protein